MTNTCTCKAEHWQPHAVDCPAYTPKPLLTLENIHSGAVPSDAVAVGFLLGEIERLRAGMPRLEFAEHCDCCKRNKITLEVFGPTAEPRAAPQLSDQSMGHGHVWPRLDGMKARCGGPALCLVCRREAAFIEALHANPANAQKSGEGQ